MKTLKELAQRAFALAKKFYEENPVRTVAYATSAVIAVLGVVGVVVDPLSTSATVALVLALLFGGEVVRQKVTPVAKAEKQVAAAKRAPKRKKR